MSRSIIELFVRKGTWSSPGHRRHSTARPPTLMKMRSVVEDLVFDQDFPGGPEPGVAGIDIAAGQAAQHLLDAGA